LWNLKTSSSTNSIIDFGVSRAASGHTDYPNQPPLFAVEVGAFLLQESVLPREKIVKNP
jgi:hypothetical protein